MDGHGLLRAGLMHNALFHGLREHRAVSWRVSHLDERTL